MMFREVISVYYGSHINLTYQHNVQNMQLFFFILKLMVFTYIKKSLPKGLNTRSSSKTILE
jgi:hypothetical protein